MLPSSHTKQIYRWFIFVELGPQHSDPSVKLSQLLYHLLTGKYLNTGDTNYAEQEIDQLITNHYQNLLVIIDDVWHIEDAEPIVRAFSHCKTVLTTRMNDVEQYIPTNERIALHILLAISSSRSGQETKAAGNFGGFVYFPIT